MNTVLSILALPLILLGGMSPSEDNKQETAKSTVYDGYTLVWHDEFNTDGRPSKEWTYEEGFVRNNELQWYQKDNATVKDGCLVIEGRKERVKNPDYIKGSNNWRTNREYAEYTSSCITTQNSFHFKYGRMEVRAKIPTASGSWPAIWAVGNMWGWPESGEIDLMEFYIKYGVPCILANACWGSTEKNKAVWDEGVTPFAHFTASDKNWADKFHVWRMDWDEHYIRLFLDDDIVNEIDLSKTRNQGYKGNKENPFSNNVEGFGDFILLNLAIGSNGGEPDLSAFPLRYYVDYVRVYKKK